MNHSCVLTSDDGVKCWGRNNYGQLGNGNTTDTHFAQNVSGLISNVRVLGRSYNHTCAILNNSEVRCWGRNDGGQLGDGTTQYRSQPVAVAGLSSPVRQIAAGSDFTCVITESGGVQCWGKNDYGQLGNGNNQSQTIPTDVAFLQRNVQAISTGVFFACALITDGSIRCWGFNVEGSLGNGNNEDQSTPVNVIGFGTPLSYTYLPLLTR
jgi:alpha-tubulin suppressor-like RCC1 family protein